MVCSVQYIGWQCHERKKRHDCSEWPTSSTVLNLVFPSEFCTGNLTLGVSTTGVLSGLSSSAPATLARRSTGSTAPCSCCSTAPWIAGWAPLCCCSFIAFKICMICLCWLRMSSSSGMCSIASLSSAAWFSRCIAAPTFWTWFSSRRKSAWKFPGRAGAVVIVINGSLTCNPLNVNIAMTIMMMTAMNTNGCHWRGTSLNRARKLLPMASAMCSNGWAITLAIVADIAC